MGTEQRGGLPPEEMGAGQAQDQDEAWAGALAQKGLRDTARDPGLEITPQEKQVLDQVAERIGVRAGQEYREEKERSVSEKLMARFDTAEAEMVKQGLAEDASIVDEIRKRFEAYQREVLQKKREEEERFGKRMDAHALMDGMPIGFHRVRDTMVLTHKIGETGGGIYLPGGGYHTFESVSEISQPIDFVQRSIKEQGAEFVDYSFSPEAAAIFLRTLGVLKEGEEPIDLIRIYEEQLAKEHHTIHMDRSAYRLELRTNVDGVSWLVDKRRQRYSSTNPEERTWLEFDEPFVQDIFDRAK